MRLNNNKLEAMLSTMPTVWGNLAVKPLTFYVFMLNFLHNFNYGPDSASTTDGKWTKNIWKRRELVIQNIFN